MKKFVEEFKKFIMRGNVMDMAVGIIIGGAFTAIVTSLVEDIISPILGLFGSANLADASVTLKEGVTLNYGSFISAIINFLLIALVIFCMVKAINKAQDKVKKPEEPAAPKTKMCPYCKSEIAIDATKCPHCTSDL